MSNTFVLSYVCRPCAHLTLALTCWATEILIVVEITFTLCLPRLHRTTVHVKPIGSPSLQHLPRYFRPLDSSSLQPAISYPQTARWWCLSQPCYCPATVPNKQSCLPRLSHRRLLQLVTSAFETYLQKYVRLSTKRSSAILTSSCGIAASKTGEPAHSFPPSEWTLVTIKKPSLSLRIRFEPSLS